MCTLASWMSFIALRKSLMTICVSINRKSIVSTITNALHVGITIYARYKRNIIFYPIACSVSICAMGPFQISNDYNCWFHCDTRHHFTKPSSNFRLPGWDIFSVSGKLMFWIDVPSNWFYRRLNILFNSAWQQRNIGLNSFNYHAKEKIQKVSSSYEKILILRYSQNESYKSLDSIQYKCLLAPMR